MNTIAAILQEVEGTDIQVTLFQSVSTQDSQQVGHIEITGAHNFVSVASNGARSETFSDIESAVTWLYVKAGMPTEDLEQTVA